MDITTAIGLIACGILIVVSIFIGGSADQFVNIPAVLITVGGTFSALMIAFPMDSLKQSINILRKTFQKPDQKVNTIIDLIVDFATTARRDGILALEEKASESNHKLLKKGVQLAVDGTAPEVLREILDNEISHLEDRHRSGSDVFGTLGALSPAFGLIGTLIGLVQMLSSVDDPASIGPGMAVCLLTTLYGAIMANVVFIPLEKKLKNRSKEEILSLELVVEGVLSIQAGDNPRIVQEKLMSYISPTIRKFYEENPKGDE